MSRFDFLGAVSIDKICALDERETLIDGFLLEKSINIVWGKSGLGKTWLCFAIAKYLSNLGVDSVYIDADNGIDLIKDRGYDEIIKELQGRITYINADFMDDSKTQMQKTLELIEEGAANGYEKALFILDSLSFFLGDGIYDEIKIYKLITFCKKIRRAGGTVIIIAHATKGGTNLRGSSSLINSVDEVWEVGAQPSKAGELNFVLSPYKQRLDVKESAFNIELKGCKLNHAVPENIKIDEKEAALIEQIKSALLSGELNQNKIYKALEKSKGDRGVQAVLDRFCGVYWDKFAGSGKNINYKLL
ncbi:AAA family ATPase [Campylobacter sp. RM9328]|uniref:AAA family ATPase n=1 Tax=Campylobacter sp. RM9328 TaxID=1705720 RepID=UPI0014735819